MTYNLHDWATAPLATQEVEEAVKEKLEAMVVALHAECVAHDVQMSCAILTFCCPNRHTLFGASHVEDPSKVPPELLIMNTLLNHGLVDGMPVIDAIIGATPERYEQSTLKLVNTDE